MRGGRRVCPAIGRALAQLGPRSRAAGDGADRPWPATATRSPPARRRSASTRATSAATGAWSTPATSSATTVAAWTWLGGPWRSRRTRSISDSTSPSAWPPRAKTRRRSPSSKACSATRPEAPRRSPRPGGRTSTCTASPRPATSSPRRWSWTRFFTWQHEGMAYVRYLQGRRAEALRHFWASERGRLTLKDLRTGMRHIGEHLARTAARRGVAPAALAVQALASTA